MVVLDALPGQAQAPQFIRSRHQFLIDGKWLDSASGQDSATLNPATEEILAEVPRGNAEDIDRAVRAARRAFDDGSRCCRMTILRQRSPDPRCRRPDPRPWR